MHTTDFEDLCAAYCTLAGIHAPEIGPDADGVLAFTVELDDIVVSVGQHPYATRDRLFVVARVGAPRPGYEDKTWPALLAANALAHEGRFSFCRNPATGSVLLQRSWRIDGMDAVALAEAIEEAAAHASAWRRAGLHVI